MAGVFAWPSQYVLQYLLSFTAVQVQGGCAHLSFLSSIVSLGESSSQDISPGPYYFTKTCAIQNPDRANAASAW